MAEVIVERKSLEDIADAIRAKGVTGTFKPGEMSGAIGNIQTDPSVDANAVAADIVSPKTAYVNGVKLTGTIIEYDGGYFVTSAVT